LSGDRNPSLNDLIVRTAEAAHWVSVVAASPSPAAYLATAICIAIFGLGDDDR
jgi:hypothetical protein